MRHADLLDFLPLCVVQLVHVAVDVVELDVLIEVGLQVFHGRRLAHGLADTGNGQMAKDVVPNGVEPDAVVDALKNHLRRVLQRPLDHGQCPVDLLQSLRCLFEV